MSQSVLTAEQVEAKRERERVVVLQMIGTYCHGNHGTAAGTLCDECAQLASYATVRVARCPRMATKTFCSRCDIHCYALDQRERIRQVMRYAGPRMLLVHPVMTVRHGLDTLAAKMRARR